MASTQLTFEVDEERALFSVPIDVAANELQELLALGAGAEFSFSAFGSDAGVLVRDGLRHGGHFAGTLSTLGVAEIFGIIISGVRSGRLIVQAAGAKPSRRTIHVRDGQIVFAASSERHERLGSALVRLGILTQAQVDEAVREVKPGARLGLVLTKSEKLSVQALYSAMTDLVREIVLGLFELDEGEFFFFEGEEAPRDALKLPEPTREVILEGIRRSEEMLSLRRRWPADVTLRKAGSVDSPLLEHLGLTEGSSQNLAALRGRFIGSEHALLSLVDELHASGILEKEIKSPAKPLPRTQSKPGSALELYAGIIAEVARALLDAGKDLSSLRAYLLEPGPKLKSAFEGVTLSDDGVLDVQKLISNVPDESDALGRVRAYDALDGFLSYALFSAQNVVPEEDFTRLREAVNVLREGS